MGLSDDLARAAEAAREFAAAGEELEAVIPAEPLAGARMYVCSYAAGERRSWLVLDDAGAAVAARPDVREAVAIAAMCELAEETAGGGDLDELRQHLVALRITENPPGIERAEDAALALQRTVAAPPRVASPAYLDEIGAATRRLEQTLGEVARSRFAEAMQAGVGAVDELVREVEARYKAPLA